MSTRKPMISVNLPTYNGADTIKQALESVKKQTYKNYEIVIVDHCSTDGTVEIAKEYTKKIYLDKNKLLNSRKIGLEKSSGDIIVFLSCDQVYEPTFLERVADLFTKTDIDMAVAEEMTYKPATIIEKLTDIDRKIIHREYELDPKKGVIMASIFKKSILKEVFKKLSQKLLDNVTIHDHAIMYYEAYKLSKKIGFVSNAVYHSEPKTISELFSHYYYWGKCGRAVKGILPEEYDLMFKSKMKHRISSINWFSLDSWLTLPIVFIKGLGYNLGSYFG